MLITTHLEALQQITKASEDLSRAILPFLALQDDVQGVVLQAAEGVRSLIHMAELSEGSGKMSSADVRTSEAARLQALTTLIDVERFLAASASSRTNG